MLDWRSAGVYTNVIRVVYRVCTANNFSTVVRGVVFEHCCYGYRIIIIYSLVIYRQLYGLRALRHGTIIKKAAQVIICLIYELFTIFMSERFANMEWPFVFSIAGIFKTFDENTLVVRYKPCDHEHLVRPSSPCLCLPAKM